MIKGWLFVVFAAMVVLAASDAQALTAYVPEGPKAGCSNDTPAKNASSAHRVGSFTLDGVSADKPSTARCSLKPGCGTHRSGYYHREVNPVVAGPWILLGAVVNDVHCLVTMPYRETERLN